MPTQSFNPSPTFRVDYEVTQNHRLTGSMNYRHINSTPDTTNNAQLPFPGFATTGSQQSTRWTTSESLRSTFGANLVNEFRVGGIGGATLFSPELEPVDVDGADARQPGRLPSELQHAPAAAPASRSRIPGSIPAQSVARSVDQGHREHGDLARRASTTSRSAGRWSQADVWLQNQTLVPTANFGLLGDRSGGRRSSTRRRCRARRRPTSRRRRTSTRC